MQQKSRKNKNVIVHNDRGDTVRLNKYISESGFCSRREADKLIESGKASKDGDSIVIDVTELGYDKVLAKGKITKSFIISAPQFSASAIEKIEEMGGEAIEL